MFPIPTMAGSTSISPCFLTHSMPTMRPLLNTPQISAYRPSLLKRPRCSPSCEYRAGSDNAVRQELSLVSTLVGAGGPQLRLSETAREKVELAAQVLETGAEGAAVGFPEDLGLLDGSWTLLYSSELNSVPRAASAVRQRFAVEDRRVENCVQFTLTPPRLPGAPDSVTGEVVLGASFDVIDNDTIGLKLVDVQLRVQQPLGSQMRDLTPRLPLPDWRFPRFTATVVRGISTDVRTTYYGEHIRVARSSGGELRIFCRQK